jgi:hypothetical protein
MSAGMFPLRIIVGQDHRANFAARAIERAAKKRNPVFRAGARAALRNPIGFSAFERFRSNAG